MSEVMKSDVDALETQDWLEALESVVREEGVERAQYLLEKVLDKARLPSHLQLNVKRFHWSKSNYVPT